MKKISEILKESIQIVVDRTEGKTRSYKTNWRNLNEVLPSGGLDYYTNFTIGGRTSTGKSAFANLLLLGILENNPQEDYIVIYWNWEMTGYQQGLRLLSNKSQKSINELLQTQKESIEALRELSNQFDTYNVYLEDRPCTADSVQNSIERLLSKEENKAKNVINLFDHTRLVLRGNARNEEEKIYRLFEVLQNLKKDYRSTNIILSQLNRKVEEDFHTHRKYRSPGLTDLFGADAVAQFSEYVMLLHRPELFNQEFLPRQVNGMDVPSRGMLLGELAKNRDGRVATLYFEHNLAQNRIDTWNPPIIFQKEQGQSTSFFQPPK